MHSESSPFYDYFLWHVNPINIWTTINIIPCVVSALVGAYYHGNPDAWSVTGFAIAFIVQWFMIGFLLSIPIAKCIFDRKMN